MVRDTTKNGIRNGRRWSLSVGQLLVIGAVFAAGNGTCAALKTCTHDAAPIVGLQTVGAAKAAEKINAEEHEAIIQAQQDGFREVKWRIEDTDEAVMEALESRSPTRAAKVKKNRKDRWRSRQRHNNGE